MDEAKITESLFQAICDYRFPNALALDHAVVGHLTREAQAYAKAIRAALTAQEWQDISTADRRTTVWLFTPGARLGADCADDVRLDAPCNWTWATMWMPAQIPAPTVAVIADDRAAK